MKSTSLSKSGDFASIVDVFIIGGGFSGIALAANLHRSDRKLRIHMSRTPSGPEFGVAYDTNCPLHLLNVPAKGMTAFPDRPSDFIDWANENGFPLAPSDFAPRMVYRKYLEWILSEFVESDGFQLVDEETIRIEPMDVGWICTLRSGLKIHAASVVLAFGGFPPACIPETKGVENHPNFVLNPWQERAVIKNTSDGRVGIIGTGLTAIDVVLSFEAQGFKGHYTLFSRRGLLPAVHDMATIPLPSDAIPRPKPNIKELLRDFRLSARQADQAGTNWRAVIDGMRPNMGAFWSALTERDKRRFLEHLRPFWEVHRHRMAPQIAKRIGDLQNEGRLTVRAGRLQPVTISGSSIDVCLSTAAGSLETHQFDWLFNCTGPTSQVTAWSSPVLQALLADGIVKTDSLERGIDADSNGQVIDKLGNPRPGLFVLGHLRRGMLWESTAVPELRVQAASLSSVISQLGARTVQSDCHQDRPQ